MKYPFKSLLLAATVLAAASCAKDDTQSGGEETAGPVITRNRCYSVAHTQSSVYRQRLFP